MTIPPDSYAWNNRELVALLAKMEIKSVLGLDSMIAGEVIKSLDHLSIVDHRNISLDENRKDA